jgi:chemosensory pili system protein ChpA (sensor histidine kinase/response regulator)
LCGPGKTSVDVGGQILPAVRLAEALDLDGVPAPLDDRVPVLAVYAGEKAYALIVDRFEDARDVVVKGFGGLLRSAPGIAATTVLGDGEVMLILNPAELPEIAPATFAAAPDEPDIGAPPTRVPGRHIMVVDDSLSVRRVLAGVLKGAGWKATIAKDGAEAVEILEHLGERPDIMLVDVEMPRMDGFELTTHLRSQTQYDQMPIVMLTSRAGEKHREKAFELGATDYLVKPFQQDQLLDTLHWAVEQSRA